MRVRALQALYACLTSGADSGEVFQELLGDAYRALRKRRDPDTGQAYDAALLYNLYKGVVDRQEEHLKLMADKMDNWDVNRVALVDRIILMMGIEEFLHHQDIPPKVTINEYIEIAREYSTEKSGQFVNGMLDALRAELNEQGRIKKTGRGLVN